MTKPVIVSEKEAVEMFYACTCGGWDIVTSMRAYKIGTEKHGACLCGQVRGYRMSCGRWTMIKDSPRILSVVPNAVPE